MRPFGCPVTILNTIDHLGSGPNWIFDIDALIKSMNYKTIVAGNQSNGNAGKKACDDADCEVPSTKEPRVNQEKENDVNNTNNLNTVSLTVNVATLKDNVVDENIVYGCADDPNMPNLEEIVYSDDDEDNDAEADMNNLNTFMLVSPILTTRLHKDHPLEQIIRDTHSTSQTRRMTNSMTEHDFKTKAFDLKWNATTAEDGIEVKTGDVKKSLRDSDIFRTLIMHYLNSQRGKRCEKNYSSVRRYIADPDNAYLKRSITKLILKGAVIFDVVSYQFRCALNYSKPVNLKSNTTEDVTSIGSFMEVLVLNHYVLVRKLFGPTTLVADETVHEERRDRMERAATTASSLEVEQGNGNIIRTQSMATLNEPIRQGTGSGSGPERQDTILGDTPTQTRFERLSKQSSDPPLSRVNTLGSGEDKHIKTAKDLGITNLRRVSRVRKKKGVRTPQLKRRLFKVRTKSSAKKSLGDQEDASKQGRNEIDQEEGISWFQEDAETQGRYGHDIEINTASTSITTASINITIDEPFITASAPVAIAGVSVSTAEPKYDVDLAQRLQAELDEEARLEREREEEAIWRLNNSLDSSNAALIEEWDSIKARIDVDAQLAERLQAKEREQMFVEERARLLMEFIAARKKLFAEKRSEEQRNKPPTKVNDFVPMDTESSGKKVESSGKKAKSSTKKAVSKKRAGENLDEESVKRQKVKDDVEKAELKACLEIVPGDDSVVNIESLATKYLIVDWKTHILAEDKMYYQIIRADGSTKYYKIFSAMLNDFDRQDVLDLYSAVEVTTVGYEVTVVNMEVTTAGYVSTVGEDCRKYSKSLLLLK
ncbi:hypothetical protein Tco_0007531 [Tanacetum coccineum]